MPLTPENRQIQVVPLENFNPGNISSPDSRRKSDYELFLVTSGHIILEYDFHSIRINKNDFHVSLPGQIMSVREYSDNLAGYYCRFESVFLEHIHMKDSLENELAYINSFMSRYPLRLTNPVAFRLKFCLDTMYSLAEEPLMDEALTHVYLATLIYEIKKLMSEQNLNPFPSKSFLITKQYSDLLALHITESQSIEFYAKKLGITPNHLNKSVKSATGKTAVSLLNEARLLEAKVKLKHSRMPVGEIAFHLGFEDHSYFTRFFKKIEGITPLEYRKNCK